MKVSPFVWRIYDKYYPEQSSPELRRILLVHSECVAAKAVEVARSADILDSIDIQFVTDAAMLHDIGIFATDAQTIHCHGRLPYICHGVEGRRILDEEGLQPRYGLVCERHTGSGLSADYIASKRLPLPLRDMLPESIEEKLICYADKFYSKSGDLRREKSPEFIRSCMSAHGEEALAGYMELEKLFAPRRH